MDINSRIVLLQQVMSTFAFTCPKNSTVMLASAENFHAWHAGLSAILTSYGSGLPEFFQSGDLSLPADVVETNDPAVIQLSLVLNNCLQVVLNHTVKYDILTRFQAEGLTGFALLTAIRRDYSTLSPRQLYLMVGELFSIKSKSPSDAAKFLRSFRTQFNHGMSIDHLFGLIFLQAFNSEDAVRRVVDSANPSLEFSAVESSLRDLIVPTTSVPVPFSAVSDQAFAVSQSGPGSRRRRKPPICYRCHQKGHKSNVCTAPAPVSASDFPSSIPSIPSAPATVNSAVTWYASTVVTSAPDSYSLDSGSTLHLSKNREHFVDFLPCSGTKVSVAGISDASLVIQGYGTVQFDIGSGRVLTVQNVAYVPNAARNLLSVKMICQRTKSHMIFENDIVKLSDGFAIGKYKSGSLYELLYAPIIPPSIAMTVTTVSDSPANSTLLVFPLPPAPFSDPPTLPPTQSEQLSSSAKQLQSLAETLTSPLLSAQSSTNFYPPGPSLPDVGSSANEAVKLTSFAHSTNAVTPWLAALNSMSFDALSTVCPTTLSTSFRSMVGKLLFASNICCPYSPTLFSFIKDPKPNYINVANVVSPRSKCHPSTFEYNRQCKLFSIRIDNSMHKLTSTNSDYMYANIFMKHLLGVAFDDLVN